MSEKVVGFRVTVVGTDEQVKELGRLDRELAKINQSIKVYQEEQASLNTQTEKGRQRNEKVNQIIGQQRTQVIALTEAKKKLENEVRNEVKLNQANINSIEGVRASMAKLRSEAEKLDLSTKSGRTRFQQLTGEIANGQKKLDSYNTQIGKTNGLFALLGQKAQGASGQLGGLAGDFSSLVGAGAVVAGTFIAVAAAAAGISVAIDKYVEFNKTFREVTNLLDKADKAKFGLGLEQGALNLVRQYGLEVGEVNKALKAAIQEGIPAGEAVAFVAQNSKLAITNTAGLSEAIHGVADILDIYNLSLSETTKVTEQLFVAQKNDAGSIAEITNSLQTIGPIAKLANISLEDSLAALVAMGKAGTRPEQAVTALRLALDSLINPTEKAAEALRFYGVPAGVAEVKSAGLRESLAKLGQVAKENPGVIKDMGFGIRELAAVTTFAGNGIEKFDSAIVKLNESTGEGSALNVAFVDTLNDIDQRAKIVSGRLDASLIELGKKFAPLKVGFQEFLIFYIEFFSKLPEFAKTAWDNIIATFDGGSKAITDSFNVTKDNLIAILTGGEIKNAGGLIAKSFNDGFESSLKNAGTKTFSELMTEINNATFGLDKQVKEFGSKTAQDALLARVDELAKTVNSFQEGTKEYVKAKLSFEKAKKELFESRGQTQFAAESAQEIIKIEEALTKFKTTEEKKRTFVSKEELKKRKDETKKDNQDKLRDIQAQKELELLSLKEGSDEFLKKQIEIINARRDVDLAGVEQNSGAAKLIVARAQSDIEKLTKDFEAKQRASEEQSFSARMISLSKQTERELKILEEKKVRGLIKEREFQEQKKQIQLRGLRETQLALTDELQRLEQELVGSTLVAGSGIAESILSDADKEKVKGRIDEIRLQLAALGVDLANVETGQNGEKRDIQSILGLGDKQMEKFNSSVSFIQGSLGQINDILGNAAQTRINQIDNEKNAELANVDAQIKAAEQRGESTEKLQAKRQQVEEKFAKKEAQVRSKLAKQQQEVSLMQAIIQGALAVIQAFAQLGPIGGAIAAGLIAGVIATQIQLMTSQNPDSATLREGGITRKGSRGFIARGAKHEQKGIRLIDMATGRFTGDEIEGNEPVLTSGVARNPYLLDLASRVNQMAGGRPLTSNRRRGFLAEGGLIPNTPTPAGSQIINESIASIVDQKIARIKVVNVVTETSTQQNSVRNVQSEATFIG